MTNTALKAQIDSQITNETTPAGITPTDVGTNLKAVVDYVDQEVFSCKVFSAILTQTGIDAPIMVVKSNTTGRTFTSTYIDIGTYGIIMTGSNLTLDDVCCKISNTSGIGCFSDIKFNGGVAFSLDTSQQNQTTFLIESSDNRLKHSSLEIRVYN